jgi:hypothetical protein
LAFFVPKIQRQAKPATSSVIPIPTKFSHNATKSERLFKFHTSYHSQNKNACIAYKVSRLYYFVLLPFKYHKASDLIIIQTHFKYHKADKLYAIPYSPYAIRLLAIAARARVACGKLYEFDQTTRLI